METLTTHEISILKAIERFDMYYEMSDSEQIYITYSTIERSIDRGLRSMSIDSIRCLHTQLSPKGRQVWNR